MKGHRIVLFLTAIFFTTIITIISLAFFFQYEKMNVYNIIGAVLLIIWFGLYPIAFYTCYRMIALETDTGKVLGRLVIGASSGGLGVAFFIPFLISPFFVYDYILFYKEDRRKGKAKEILEVIQND